MPLVLQSPAHVPPGVMSPFPVADGDAVFVESWSADTNRVSPAEVMRALYRALQTTNVYGAPAALDTALMVAACSERQSLQLLETLVSVAADAVRSTQPLRLALRLLYTFDARRRQVPPQTRDEMAVAEVRRVAHAILTGEKVSVLTLPFGRDPVANGVTVARLKAAVGTAAEPDGSDMITVATGVRVQHVAKCLRAVLPWLRSPAKQLLGNIAVTMSRHPRVATALAGRALLLLRAPGDAATALRRSNKYLEPTSGSTHAAFMLHSPSFRGPWDLIELDDNLAVYRQPHGRFTVLPFRWQQSPVLTAATPAGDLVIFRPACQMLLRFWSRVHRRPAPRFASTTVDTTTLHMLMENPAAEVWAHNHGLVGVDIPVAVLPGAAAEAQGVTAVTRDNVRAVVETLVVCAYLQCQPPPRIANMLVATAASWPVPIDAAAQPYQGRRTEQPRLLHPADRETYASRLNVWLGRHRQEVAAMVTRINKAMRSGDRADKARYYGDPKAPWCHALTS